jgi:hypothetical protein
MKWRISVVLTLIIAASAAAPAPASADPRHPQVPVQVVPTSQGLSTAITKYFPGHASAGEPSGGGSAPAVDSENADGVNVLTVTFDEALLNSFCAGVNWTSGCVRQPVDVAPAVASQTPIQALTLGMVARAFRAIDLPGSQIQVQPPKGRTLVNFDTNFYTHQPAFDRTVTLLGRRVDLRIWPSQFRWVFGDGSEFPSASPGAPYPDLLITHKYLHRGGVNPRVDTTYSARFRVDGGAWRDVAGTVTIPGEPVALRVITATPVLVGSD